MTCFISGHFDCRCREVQERVNVWTVCQDKKSCRCTEVAVISFTVLHKGSKNQNGCQTFTIKFLVMHTTFQDLKLIPGHPGEKRKS